MISDPDKATSKAHARPGVVIGWREWVGLPDLGIAAIKAKVDTGAKTSALHAFGLSEIERDGVQYATFEIHPFQRSSEGGARVEAEIVDRRAIRSSSGQTELRPVIRTTVTILDRPCVVDVTLTLRDAMGFRMLLGRHAIRGLFVVDVARSYIGGRPPRHLRRPQPGGAETSRSPVATPPVGSGTTKPPD